MRVVVAEKAGACFGVQRALDMVERLARDASAPVSTLGPLIHNPRVVRDLAEAGVAALSSVAEAREGTLVLRTHGVPPAVEDEARAAGLSVADATCPFVRRAQSLAAEMASEGRVVVVVGQAGHAEVEGIVGHAPGAYVVTGAEEARALGLSGAVGVLAQTTQVRATFEEVVAALRETCASLRVENTICTATSERQQAAASLAARADVMLVVGGHSSANTCHLAQVCAQACPRTHHIEDASELSPAWFAGATLVGVTAGASTPAAHIAEVVAAAEALS